MAKKPAQKKGASGKSGKSSKETDDRPKILAQRPIVIRGGRAVTDAEPISVNSGSIALRNSVGGIGSHFSRAEPVNGAIKIVIVDPGFNLLDVQAGDPPNQRTILVRGDDTTVKIYFEISDA
jgi:hypothetical protein